MRLQEESNREACRRERAYHPAHGEHHVLASGWDAYFGTAVHGALVWQVAGVLQE